MAAAKAKARPARKGREDNEQTKGGAPERAPAGRGARLRWSIAARPVLERIEGPVLARLREIVPELGPVTVEEILESPVLLDGCVRVFRQHRARFCDLLLDEAGLPVAGDDRPVAPCGRTVDEVVAMVARTCARRHFQKALAPSAPLRRKAAPRTLIERLEDMIRRLWTDVVGAPEKAKPLPVDPARRHYEAMKPLIREDWQIPLVPLYATLPTPLVAELGEGLLALRTPEQIEGLVRLGRRDFSEAQEIVGRDLAREMLDHQPLAAGGVKRVGKREFDRLAGALRNSNRMSASAFWDLFASNEMLDALATKNARDIAELAAHLHRIAPATVETLATSLPPQKLGLFLQIGVSVLGEARFEQVFGEDQDPAVVRVFVRKAGEIRHDQSRMQDFVDQLRSVFQAYARNPEGFAKIMF